MTQMLEAPTSTTRTPSASSQSTIHRRLGTVASWDTQKFVWTITRYRDESLVTGQTIERLYMPTDHNDPVKVIVSAVEQMKRAGYDVTYDNCTFAVCISVVDAIWLWTLGIITEAHLGDNPNAALTDDLNIPELYISGLTSPILLRVMRVTHQRVTIGPRKTVKR